MRAINELILHCSATKASQDIGAKEIRNWHVNGNKWYDIGYHYVIKRDGTLEKGRDDTKIGAHCSGHNAHSIGICLVGGLNEQGKVEDNFNKEQFDTLSTLIKDLRNKYETSSNHVFIEGHNTYAAKACPVFDVTKFLKEYGIDK